MLRHPCLAVEGHGSAAGQAQGLSGKRQLYSQKGMRIGRLPSGDVQGVH